MQNKRVYSLKQWMPALGFTCLMLIATAPFVCRADDAATPVPASQAAPPATGTAPLLELPAVSTKPAPPLALPSVSAPPPAPPIAAAVPSPLPAAVPATPAAVPEAVPASATAATPIGRPGSLRKKLIKEMQDAAAQSPDGAPVTTPVTSSLAAPVTDNGLQNAGGPPVNPNIQVTKETETGFSAKLLPIAGATMVNVLQEPVNIPTDFSLMFTKKEMQTIVEPSLVLYDKSAEAQIKSGGAQAGDDLTGLLESLKIKGDSKQAIKPPAPPNLYLGSIVYYSPANWSVWINGKKIVARLNNEKNVLFVNKIDRSEIVLVWRPSLFKEVIKAWNPGAHSQFVSVDEKNGTVTLRMHPNQTFVPTSMTVNEGLIIQKEAATQAVTDAASPEVKPESEATALGKAIRNHN